MRCLTAMFLGLIFAALVPSALVAQDKQPKIDAFVGLSYLRPPISVIQQVVYCPVEGTCSVPGTIDRTHAGLVGPEVAGAYHFAPHFAITGDVSGNFGPATSGFPRNARAHQYTYLAGPQISFGKSRLSPFVHVLGGAVHQSINSSGNSFFITFPENNWGLAIAAGGGIDVRIAPSFSFRLVQADYMLTRIGSNFQNQPRVSAGFVLHF